MSTLLATCRHTCLRNDFRQNRFTDLFRPSFAHIDICHCCVCDCHASYCVVQLLCLFDGGSIAPVLLCDIASCSATSQQCCQRICWCGHCYSHVLLCCIIATNEYVGVDTSIHTYNMCEHRIRNVLCVCGNCHLSCHLSPYCVQPNMSVWPTFAMYTTCVHIYTHW